MIIKVCGITNADDLRIAVDAGANALGFIFAPASPRYITPEHFAGLAELVPAGVRKVGVFVGAPLDLPGLDAVQIYGDVSHGNDATNDNEADGHERSADSRVAIWRAYRISSSLPELDSGAEAVLLDGAGNGISYDWSLARGIGRRVIVAGGLDASNVDRAIETAQPWGVDACSRLESAPGKKDPAKVRAFVKAALAAFQTHPV